MQYHEVKINIELSEVKNCYWAATKVGTAWNTDLTAVQPSSLPSCSLFVDYIYLDTDERRRRLDQCDKKVHAENILALFSGNHLISQGKIMRQHLVAIY